MGHSFLTFDTGAALAASLAEAVSTALAAGIAKRGRATLVVSGGSTPKLFFEALSHKPIDWQKVDVTLVDERFVPPDSDRSNHALVTATLLKNAAGSAGFTPLFHASMTAAEAARAASSALAALTRPFDVVVLGMGGDGHTASFFPGGDRLEEALAAETPPGVITMQAEGAGEMRLTLTFSAIADARMLVLHIEGEAKKAVIDRALSEGGDSALPIGRVIATAKTDTQIYWAP